MIVPRFRLPPETVGRIRQKGEALLAARPDLFWDYASYLVETDEAWLEFAGIPEILDALEQLIGPDFLNWGA